VGVSFIQSTVCITNDWWCIMKPKEITDDNQIEIILHCGK